MTEEELIKLMRVKMAEANLKKHTTDIANLLCDIYMKGFTDGFDIGTKIK